MIERTNEWLNERTKVCIHRITLWWGCLFSASFPYSGPTLLVSDVWSIGRQQLDRNTLSATTTIKTPQKESSIYPSTYLSIKPLSFVCCVRIALSCTSIHMVSCCLHTDTHRQKARFQPTILSLLLLLLLLLVVIYRSYDNNYNNNCYCNCSTQRCTLVMLFVRL